VSLDIQNNEFSWIDIQSIAKGLELNLPDSISQSRDQYVKRFFDIFYFGGYFKANNSPLESVEECISVSGRNNEPNPDLS
jgi:hypothetical protein